MERACEVQLRAEAAGRPVVIEPEVANQVRDIIGTHRAGWGAFQPLYEWIVGDEPGLLE